MTNYIMKIILIVATSYSYSLFMIAIERLSLNIEDTLKKEIQNKCSIAKWLLIVVCVLLFFL